MNRSPIKQYIFWILIVFLLGWFLGMTFYALSTHISRHLSDSTGNQGDRTDSVLGTTLHYRKPLEVPTLSVLDFKKVKSTIKAKSFLVKDLDNGSNILLRDSGDKLPIASVTKLITAMVAIDNMHSDDIVQMSKRAVDTLGHQGNLAIGEKFKLIDLVNCLLLESSNDAAEALAEHVGRDKFLLLMNSKAQEIGMANTKFKDPSGLSIFNISTTEDLTTLIEYIRKNRTDVLDITAKRFHKVVGGNMSHDHVWLNRNRLIRQNNDFYIGGKDGFTSDALMTFVGVFSVSVTEIDQKRFSIALLRSSDRNGDVDRILSGLTASLQYQSGGSFADMLKERRLTKKAIEPEKNVSLMFVGDIMMDQGVQQMINLHGGDFMFPFEYVPFLKDSDILFANLDGPVSDQGYDLGNVHSFRMDPKVIPALAQAGFTVVSLANNHIGDWGLTAFEDTLNRLRSGNILPVGAGYTKSNASTVKIVERNGIKVGFLGFSDVGPTWLTHNDSLPSILSASDPEIKSIISNAAKKVNHLVVSFHFGEEYRSKVTDRQRDLAHMAVDAGAKIVIGHYPHVVQKIERYKGGLIAYSLGNFIFDKSLSRDATSGDMLEVILDKADILEINENQVVQNAYFQPHLVEESGK
ncbi:MAG: CapA family protein [Candidatus Vogelbacteria bacterium]|nr:CapA family protein [Candidatus Vogelbacteria bacterium]